MMAPLLRVAGLIFLKKLIIQGVIYHWEIYVPLWKLYFPLSQLPLNLVSPKKEKIF